MKHETLNQFRSYTQDTTHALKKGRKYTSKQSINKQRKEEQFEKENNSKITGKGTY